MLERFGIMKDTQAVDGVTLDFKGLVFSELSAALQVNVLYVHTFLNDHSLLYENLNEMRSYI